MLHLAEGYQKSRCLGYDKQWWSEKGKEKIRITKEEQRGAAVVK